MKGSGLAAIQHRGDHLRLSRPGLERFIGYLTLVVGNDGTEFIDDLCGGYPVEVEMLAPAEDGLGYLVRLGSRKDKFGVERRLFEGLEEGVEGLFGEHVHFVDDVDLVIAVAGGVADRLGDPADIVDAAVGGAVDL